MAEIKDTNSFTINGWMVKQLGLSGNELMVYAIIHGFSQDYESEFYGSRSYIASFINASKRTVDSVLLSLQNKGLIEKHTSMKNGITTNTYSICKNCTGGAEIARGVAEIAPNNKVYNKDKENYIKETETNSTTTLQANDENQLSIESVGIETGTNTCTTLTAHNETSDYNKVVGYFEQTWKIYPRKESKIQARTTFAHKVFTKSQTESHKLALRIYKALERQKVVWENENNGKGRDKQYIPLFSSWLNDNFDDIPKKERGKM